MKHEKNLNAIKFLSGCLHFNAKQIQAREQTSTQRHIQKAI